MGGGEVNESSGPASQTHIAAEPRGPPTESEEIQHRLETGAEGEGEEDVEEEGLKVRREKESKAEAVAEKVAKS